MKGASSPEPTEEETPSQESSEARCCKQRGGKFYHSGDWEYLFLVWILYSCRWFERKRGDDSSFTSPVRRKAVMLWSTLEKLKDKQEQVKFRFMKR